MKRRVDWKNPSDVALTGMLMACFFYPGSMAMAQDSPAHHVHQQIWMVALSPHATIMLVLAFVAGMLAVYLRKSAWARMGLGAVAVALPLTSFTQIAVIPVPNTFADGQAASASEVNQNFQAVVQQIANHANDMDLHGGGEAITSVDGLLGGTISGDVSLEDGTLFADQVGTEVIALLDEFGEAVMVISSSDGIVTMGAPGTSAFSFSPDGDTRVDGRNVFITGIDGSVVIENEVSGSIFLKALENTTVTTGQTTSITSGTSHDVTAGDSTTITSANATNITAGGTASVNANRIELNAP